MCAAHCKQAINQWRAGAGSININGQRQNKSGSTQLQHPDYMILTIQGSWKYDDYVKPIKIVNPANSELPNNTPCQSSGYGYTTHILSEPGVIASSLHWMDISCITFEECKKLGYIKSSLPECNVPPPTVSLRVWVTLAVH